MYIPRAFREQRLDVLHALIDANDFGLLTSVGEDGLPQATHVPFLLDRTAGPNGTLRVHVARANPQWQSLADGTKALAVFLGPHAHVSPSWYSNQRTVPTWNYAAVHASGSPRRVDDPVALLDLVTCLADRHESRRGSDWTVSRAADVIDGLLKAIVGFEIPIEHIEGQFKFSQNGSREDRAGVVVALRESGNALDRAVADIMQANLEGG